MATIADLKVRLGADVSDFDKKLKGVQKSISKMGNSMTSMGKSMTIGVTAPLGLLAGAALKSASMLETMEVAFESMLGSGTAASAMVKDLTNFAASTPFQMEGIGKAAKQLLSFGVQGDEVLGKLKFLGDVAAGANVPLSDMAAIFGKAKAKGKAMTEELLQLSDRGVPIIDVLATKMGVAKEEIFKMASEGKISFEILQEAMKSMSQEGGIFEDQMAKQSNTLAGVFSTLGDNATLAFAEIGKGIMEVFDLKEVMKDVITAIQSATQWFKDLSDTQKKWIIGITAAVAAMGPLLVAAGFLATTILPALITGFGLLLSPIGLIVIAVAAAATAIVVFWDEISSAFVAAWAGIKMIGKNMVDSFALIPELIIDAFKEVPMAFVNMFKGIGSIISAVLTGDFAAIPELLKEAGKNLVKTNPLAGAAVKIGKLFTEGVATEFVNTFSSEMAGKVADADLEEANKAMKDTGKKLGTSVAIGVAEGVQTAMAKAVSGQDTMPILMRLRQDFELANEEAKLFGEDGLTVLKQKMQLLRAAMSEGIATGKLSQEQIEALKVTYQGLDQQIDQTIRKQEQLNAVSSAVSGAVGDAFQGLSNKIVASFGEAETGFDRFKQGILQTVIKLISMMLSQAIAQAISGATASGAATGPAAIVTTPAFIATAVGGVLAAFAAIPSFAEGGLVSGPTLAMVGEGAGSSRRNPEVIAPLDKLQGLIGGNQMGFTHTIKLRGEDIEIVLNRVRGNRGFIQGM